MDITVSPIGGIIVSVPLIPFPLSITVPFPPANIILGREEERKEEDVARQVKVSAKIKVEN